MHSSVSRIGKAVDKNFISDYVCVGNDNLFEQGSNSTILNKVIVEHLLRQGKSDIAEKLIEEGKLDVDTKDKVPYIKMNKILGNIFFYNDNTINLLTGTIFRCSQKPKLGISFGMGPNQP